MTDLPPDFLEQIDELERETLAALREPPFEQEHVESVIMRLFAQLRILAKSKSKQQEAK